MNIQKEINYLKARLDKLEKQVKGKNPLKRYLPNYMEKYFYVDTYGHINKNINNEPAIHKYTISIGNCFKTEEEAGKHQTILTNTQKLKDVAQRLNKGKPLDWDDYNQEKYLIVLEDDMLITKRAFHLKQQGVVYCLDENFLYEAVEEIGAEELIELVRGE